MRLKKKKHKWDRSSMTCSENKRQNYDTAIVYKRMPAAAFVCGKGIISVDIVYLDIGTSRLIVFEPDRRMSGVY